MAKYHADPESGMIPCPHYSPGIAAELTEYSRAVPEADPKSTFGYSERMMSREESRALNFSMGDPAAPLRIK